MEDVGLHIVRAKGEYKLNLKERIIASVFIGSIFVIYIGMIIGSIAFAIWAVKGVMS